MDNKPECKLIDTDGNVFAIISKVRVCLRKHDCAALETFDCDLADMQKQGCSYDEILALVMKYVDVV